MPETRWTIITAPWYDRLDLVVTVDTDAPGIIELIEHALDSSGIHFERQGDDDDS